MARESSLRYSMDMKNVIENFILDGTACSVHRFGATPPNQRLPLFVMPVAFPSDDMMEGQHTLLDDSVDRGCVPAFVTVTFVVAHWNNDLSPWPAPSLFKGEEDFAGNASKTLDWIMLRLVPAMQERFPAGGVKGIIGGSMGGLFALWAIHETDFFSVCASCSGSLWYSGFVDYLEKHQPKAPFIYLSLGVQEEKARNQAFRQVGEGTRRAAELLQASPETQNVVLEWFPGGHSGHTGSRFARAHTWMAENAR